MAQYMEITRTRYALAYNGKRLDTIDHKGAARILTGKIVLPAEFSVIREEVWVAFAPVCRHCKARPCAVEQDCDGAFWRTVCEQDQCQRGRGFGE